MKTALKTAGFTALVVAIVAWLRITLETMTPGLSDTKVLIFGFVVPLVAGIIGGTISLIVNSRIKKVQRKEDSWYW